MNALCRQLAEICRDRLLEEKWLLAPSRRVAAQWLEQVTRSGQPAVNVRVQTIRSLALELAAPRIAAEGLTLMPPALRPIVVAAAWARAVTARGGYFAATRVTPRLLETVGQTLGDLRLAGVRAAAMHERTFESPAKAADLRELLAAYEAELAARRIADEADALRFAAERATGDLLAPAGRLMLVPDDLELPKLAASLLDAIPQGCLITLRTDTDTGTGTGTGTGAGAGAGAVSIVHAVGEANEVRQALRMILAEGHALDHAELLHTDGETYVPLIYELAQRVLPDDPGLELGVPVTFAEGLPARLTRPGRLLAAWLHWIDDGHPQSTLLRMIEDGLLETGATSAARLARSLRGVGIGFQRGRYAPQLDAHVTALRAQLDDPPWRGDADDDDAAADRAARRRERLLRRLDDAESLRGLVGALLDATPAAPTGGAMLDGSVALVERLAHASSRLDKLARQRLLQELRATAEVLTHEELGASFDASAWLHWLLENLRIGGSGPRPGHIHVARWSGGGHSGRGLTILLGLDDGRFPPGGLQDPLLLDRERRGLDEALPVAAERAARQIEQMRALLRRLNGRVVLSFSCRAIVDDREVFASPMLLEIFRLLSGNRGGDYGDLLEWLGPPASFAPRRAEEALDAGEWWLWCGIEHTPDGVREMLRANFAGIGRGWVAQGKRRSSRFTAWDGRVESPGPELDPAHPDARPISPTALELMGKCPLAYFYKQVLGIRPPEEFEIDRERWLSALDFGSLLHDVLYDFLGELIGRGTLPPCSVRDRALLRGIADRHVAAWRTRIPPPNEPAFHRQVQELQGATNVFLVEQGRVGDRSRPVYLEAAFGMAPTGAGTPIDSPDPVHVELPDGAALRFRGRLDRIDRLDRAGPPAFAIIDYKSGSSYGHDGTFGAGRKLQPILYMAAAEVVLRERVAPDAAVVDFSYFFTGERGRGRRVVHRRADLQEGIGIVQRLRQLSAAGCFPATDDVERDCTFCEFRAACCAVTPDLDELGGATCCKLHDEANAGLAPFVELRHGP